MKGHIGPLGLTENAFPVSTTHSPPSCKINHRHNDQWVVGSHPLPILS